MVVALQIAYLPALYGAFNRREGLVALLESRAGVPAWGPEVLVRHQLVGITDTLPEFYAAWEAWAADLAESHTTYPVLLLFRSPEAWYSWLIGLLAVLDGAAMHLALAPSSASSQARLCLRMGFTALNRIAKTLGWEVDPDPSPEGPIALTYEEFAEAVEALRDAGFAMESDAERAWPVFVGWRVNYERVAYRLADRVTAPPAPWSGPRRHLRSGPVAPRRPPQRSPGGFSYDEHRPPVVLAAPSPGFRSVIARSLAEVNRPPSRQRLSNSVTPRAPRRWRTVVGRVDKRSAADASPNHRRLLLGFRHLPSVSSVVRTYPRKCPIGGIADSLGPPDYPRFRPPCSDRAAARCMHLVVRRHLARLIGKVRLRRRSRLERIEIGFGREDNFELDLGPANLHLRQTLKDQLCRPP